MSGKARSREFHACCLGLRNTLKVRTMGMAKYVRASFAQSAKERSESYTLRLRKWRKGPVVVRQENPTNPIRARELGYKATKDFCVAVVRIRRGRHVRRQPDLGRKPGRNRKRVEPGRALMWYATNRAARKFTNLTPINAYWVGEDGVYKYFEVIFRNDNDSTPLHPKKAFVQPQAKHGSEFIRQKMDPKGANANKGTIADKARKAKETSAKPEPKSKVTAAKA